MNLVGLDQPEPDKPRDSVALKRMLNTPPKPRGKPLQKPKQRPTSKGRVHKGKTRR
jgi:hypothetical protein